MRQRLLQSVSFLAAWSMLSAALVSPSWAAVTCAQSQAATQEDDSETQADSAKCNNGAWDPPDFSLPDPGNNQVVNKASGANGYIVPSVQAPQMPPKDAGAPPSVSASVMQFNALITGLFAAAAAVLAAGGNQAQVAAASPTGGAAAGAASTCPIRDVAGNVFGDYSTFGAGAFSKSLSCGGAVQLTNYRITLVPNPSGLVVTEQGTNFAWVYQASNSGYTLVGGAAMALPQYLCEEFTDSNGQKHRRRAALPADVAATGFTPQAQMITYNSNTQSIALRVMHDDSAAAASASEYYMVLPLNGGALSVPLDDSHGDQCSLQTTSYQAGGALNNSSLNSAMIIESSLQAGCEESAGICQAAGLSVTPTSGDSCQTSTIYPAGASCTSKQQYLLLDHPNLVFPPGANMSAVPVQQRTSYMVSTTSGVTDRTKLIGPSGFVVQLNRANVSYTLTSGGIMSLGSKQLQMNGPATINMSSLSVSLPNGGQMQDQGGSTISTYDADATVSIDASALPVVVTSNGDIQMPDGFSILSQPAGAVREPMDIPK